MTDDVDKEFLRKYCIRFGKIAVDLKFITPEQLKEALNDQIDDDLSNRPHRLIGQIFFEKGWLTPQQIDTILDKLFKGERENE